MGLRPESKESAIGPTAVVNSLWGYVAGGIAASSFYLTFLENAALAVGEMQIESNSSVVSRICTVKANRRRIGLQTVLALSNRNAETWWDVPLGSAMVELRKDKK